MSNYKKYKKRKRWVVEHINGSHIHYRKFKWSFFAWLHKRELDKRGV